MTTMQELAERAHATAKAKGWYDQPRTVLELVALCHSELSEALEEWRMPTAVAFGFHDNGKPWGYGVEIADALIRLLDMGEYLEPGAIGRLFYNCSLSGALKHPMPTLSKSCSTFPEWIALAHEWLADIGRANRYRPDRNLVDVCFAISGVVLLAHNASIDLDECIKAKMDYNDTRPHRHGGKRA